MHRIDASGSVNGQFSDGNPQAGQQATVVDAAWLNAMQENIVRVIEHAAIVLEKGNVEQLYLAIVAIATGAAGAGGGSVPTSRLVNASGLATGGGALTNDVLITVAKASAADVTTGTDDAKATTPAAIATAFAGTKGATAIIPLPGGWLMMAGSGTATGNGTTVITLPTTFPNLCVFAGCEGAALNNSAQDNNPAVSGKGVGSISIFSAVDGSLPITWFAIGY